MDKFLFNAFADLQDRDVSGSLHTSTLHAVTFRRYRSFIILITSLVAVNFIVSVWHLYTRMIEVDAISVIRSVIDTFEPSLDSFSDSATTLLNFLPIQAVFLSLLSLISLVFMIIFVYKINQLEFRRTIA